MKKLWFSALLCLLFTILWLVFMFLSLSRTGAVDTLEKAVISAEKGGLFFYINYINASLVTLTAAIFYVCLFCLCKELNKEWSYIGITFIPVYSTLNLLVYLSQVTVIPRLVALMESSDHPEVYKIVLGQMVQSWSGSMISVMNQSAYMILGIPSVIFGVLLIKSKKVNKIFNSLFIANGIACILGGIGTILNHPLISLGSLIGGILFLFALAAIVISSRPTSVSFTTNTV